MLSQISRFLRDVPSTSEQMLRQYCMTLLRCGVELPVRLMRLHMPRESLVPVKPIAVGKVETMGGVRRSGL